MWRLTIEMNSFQWQRNIFLLRIISIFLICGEAFNVCCVVLTCWWTVLMMMMMTRWCCVVTQPWNSSAWLTFCHLSLMTESGWWTAGRSMWLLQVYSWCLLTHCRPWGDTSGQPLTPGPWTQIIPTSGFPCWFTINLGHWCWGLEDRLTRAYTRVEIFFFCHYLTFLDVA